MTLPFLKSLRNALPNAHISILASKLNYKILLKQPYIDEILIWPSGFYPFTMHSLINKIRNSHFDLIIDPVITHELKLPLLNDFFRSKYQIGFEIEGRSVFYNLPCPEISAEKHIIEYHRDLIEKLGFSLTASLPEIFIEKDEKIKAIKILERKGLKKEDVIIAIHPGGYYKSQKWPPEKFGIVAQKLINETDAKILIICSEKEYDSAMIINDIAGGKGSILHNLDLREFLSVLGLTRLLLCNNSAPLHLAAALGVPTVSTMGPTIPYLWWPLGENQVVVREDGIFDGYPEKLKSVFRDVKGIPVDLYYQAVKKQLKDILK